MRRFVGRRGARPHDRFRSGGRLAPRNAQGECYLTDLVALAVEDGEPVESIEVARWQEALGVNTPEQLRETERWLAGP